MQLNDYKKNFLHNIQSCWHSSKDCYKRHISYMSGTMKYRAEKKVY